MEKEIGSQQAESILKPLLGVIPCFASHFQMGVLLGQSSTMLPQLQAPDSKIKIDNEFATWIASIAMIGAPISSILCGPLTDKLGRKAMIKLFLLIAAISHIIIGISNNVTELLIGRFSLGFAYGFSFPTFVYIAEVCTPKYRGMFLAMGTVCSSVGLIYVMIVGGILSWEMTSFITAIIATISLIYAFFIPETPAWLFQNHKLDEAIESVRWLKGKNCNVDDELKLLKDNSRNQSSGVSIFRQLSKPTVIKPFLIILFLAILQNGCGFYIFILYSVNICEVFKTGLDPWIISIGLSVTRLVGCLVSTYAQKRTKRRILGSVSGITTAITLAVLLLTTYTFKNEISNIKMYPAVVATCLVAYIFLCSLGIYPLPWLLVFELYPLNVRGLMCGVSYAVTILASFTSVKLFYFFMDVLDVHGTILMFLIFSILFALYSICILPETHGKTLAEIEQGFISKKPKQNASET